MPRNVDPPRPPRPPSHPSPATRTTARGLALVLGTLASIFLAAGLCEARFGDGALRLRWTGTESLRAGTSRLLNTGENTRTESLDLSSLTLVLVAPGRERVVALAPSGNGPQPKRVPDTEDTFEARFPAIDGGLCHLLLRRDDGQVLAVWDLLVRAELTTVASLDLAEGRLEVSSVHPDPFGDWEEWDEHELRALPGVGEDVIDGLDTHPTPRFADRLDGGALARPTRMRPEPFGLDDGLVGIQIPQGSLPPAFGSGGRWLATRPAPATGLGLRGSIGGTSNRIGQLFGAARTQTSSNRVLDASFQLQWEKLDNAGPLAVGGRDLGHNGLESVETRGLLAYQPSDESRVKLTFYAVGFTRDYYLQEFRQDLAHAPREDRAQLLGTLAYDFAAGPSRVSLEAGYSRAFMETGDDKAFDVFERYRRDLEQQTTDDGLYWLGDDPGTAFDEGHLFDYYVRSLTQDWTLRLDTKSDWGRPFPLRLGGEIHEITWRYYEHLAPSQVAVDGPVAGYRLATYFGYTQNGDHQADPAGHAARKPQRLALYASQRLRAGELDVEGGLRWERFRPGQKPVHDPADVLGADQQLTDADLDPEPTDSHVDPRLGAYLALDPRTHLWVDGGRSRQIPPFEALYYDPAFLALQAGLAQDTQILEAQRMIFGNPGLKPEATWEAHAGIRRELSARLSVRASAHLGETSDTWVARSQVAGQDTLAFYDNRGTRRERGLHLGLRLDTGRQSEIRALYDLGKIETNVIEPAPLYRYLRYPGTPVENLASPQTALPYSRWLDDGVDRGFFPSMLDRRHRLAVSFITALNPEDLGFAGYAVGKGNLALTFRAASGAPYTPTYVREAGLVEGSLQPAVPLFDPGIQTETLPWIWQIDAAISQFFRAFALDFVARVEVRNLTNRKNANQVYTATGEADDDGWLQSAAGRAEAERLGNAFVESYQDRVDNPLHYDDGIAARVALTVSY